MPKRTQAGRSFDCHTDGCHTHQQVPYSAACADSSAAWGLHQLPSFCGGQAACVGTPLEKLHHCPTVVFQVVLPFGRLGPWGPAPACVSRPANKAAPWSATVLWGASRVIWDTPPWGETIGPRNPVGTPTVPNAVCLFFGPWAKVGKSAVCPLFPRQQECHQPTADIGLDGSSIWTKWHALSGRPVGRNEPLVPVACRTSPTAPPPRPQSSLVADEEGFAIRFFEVFGALRRQGRGEAQHGRHPTPPSPIAFA